MRMRRQPARRVLSVVDEGTGILHDLVHVVQVQQIVTRLYKAVEYIFTGDYSRMNTLLSAQLLMCCGRISLKAYDNTLQTLKGFLERSQIKMQDLFIVKRQREADAVHELDS